MPTLKKIFTKKIKNFLAVGLLILVISPPIYFCAFSKNNISDYQPTFIPLYDQANKLNIAIRMYYINSDLYFLCVDPNTLQTKTLAAKQTKFRVKPDHFSMQALLATPYMKLLHNFSQAPYQTENYGITRAQNKTNGMFLTIDMCPSTKPFEKRLFLALESRAYKLHKPLPIAISISGLWLLEHQQEFAWLIKQQSSNKLTITWINHSFSHPYYPDLPMEKNFLTIKPKFLEQEVLATEKLLLENGQIPSIYFRFPGLVSNKNLIMQLKELGLIAIGSDAWLAKNEQPQNGSFILIHGNGNEPLGVDKFLLLLQNNNPTLLALIPYSLV